eukprot:CAMPEP_0196802968 /NCGR_PEP_ID=MMETSP1362-20130617/2458_1 /TAXON_ID=163516 /ORGANISM="Leptocylindrus danicus, Strain CCMP1856" /LENGTH=561 /DNA_ID=CAMNT_0042174389 /DNA_START=15 /DNA_END=1697 /DNA_ORIENTATION=-
MSSYGNNIPSTKPAIIRSMSSSSVKHHIQQQQQQQQQQVQVVRATHHQPQPESPAAVVRQSMGVSTSCTNNHNNYLNRKNHHMNVTNAGTGAGGIIVNANIPPNACTAFPRIPTCTRPRSTTASHTCTTATTAPASTSIIVNIVNPIIMTNSAATAPPTTCSTAQYQPMVISFINNTNNNAGNHGVSVHQQYRHEDVHTAALLVPNSDHNRNCSVTAVTASTTGRVNHHGSCRSTMPTMMRNIGINDMNMKSLNMNVNTTGTSMSKSLSGMQHSCLEQQQQKHQQFQQQPVIGRTSMQPLEMAHAAAPSQQMRTSNPIPIMALSSDPVTDIATPFEPHGTITNDGGISESSSAAVAEEANKECKEDNGNSSVPRGDGGNFMMACVDKQNQTYKQPETRQVSFVTSERGKKSKAAGFQLSQYTWNSMFQELQSYKAKHGHCNVPRNSGALGNWVYSQRQRYQLSKEGKLLNACLSENQVQMLESIGFQWSLNAPENSIVIPTTGTANDVGLQKPVPPTDDTHWKMVEVSSNDDCKMDDGADTYDAPFDEPIVSSSQAENEDN